MVYAFDETDRDPSNNRPDRKYVFTPQQLPAHYSKSKIGHSYSVWLPWDEVGGPQKELTLIIRFQPKEGTVAISDPCRQLLPGRTAPARCQVAAGPQRSFGTVPWGFRTSNAPSLRECRNRSYSRRRAARGYQTPITDGTGVVTAAWQQRQITTATIDVPTGSAIRSAITSPQVSWATAGEYPPGPGRAGPMPASGQNYAAQNYGRKAMARRAMHAQNYPAQNYPAQNYPPQNCPPLNYPPQNYPPRNMLRRRGMLHRRRPAGDIVIGPAGVATPSWFWTCSTVASRRTTRSAKSRSCSVAATPRRIAVWPCISTWTGPCQCSPGRAIRCCAIAELTCWRPRTGPTRARWSRWSAPMGVVDLPPCA